MSVVRLPLQVQIVYLKDMSVVFDEDVKLPGRTSTYYTIT